MIRVLFIVALAALQGCSLQPTSQYTTAAKTAVTSLKSATVETLAKVQNDELSDQQSALSIAKAAADRDAITCAQQGVNVSSVQATGPMSMALKLDEYALMAAHDCSALNTKAIQNFGVISLFFAGLGL